MSSNGADTENQGDSTQLEIDSVKPLPSRPSIQHLIAAAAGTLCAFFGLSSVVRQTEAGLQISDRLIAGGATVVMAAGLLASTFAWRQGGFNRLKELDVPPIVQTTKEFTARTVHGLGQALQGLGVFLACIVILFAITGESAKWAAIGSAGSYLLGKFLASILKGMPITTTARLNALKPELQEVGQQTEQARTGLVQISTKIAELDKEVREKNSRLNHIAMTNDELNKRLGASPSELAYYRAALRHDQRKNMRQQWLGVIAGVVAGFVLGYVVNLTSDSILEWLRSMTGWMS